MQLVNKRFQLYLYTISFEKTFSSFFFILNILKFAFNKIPFLDVKYLWVMEQSFMINTNPGSSTHAKH